MKFHSISFRYSPVMEKVIIGIVSGLLLSYTYVKNCKGNSTFLMLQT